MVSTSYLKVFPEVAKTARRIMTFTRSPARRMKLILLWYLYGLTTAASDVSSGDVLLVLKCYLLMFKWGGASFPEHNAINR